MTKDEALTTDRFHYGECVKTVGPRGGVTITREEWRRNGKSVTWKGDSGRFRVTIKYGMRTYDSVNEFNVENFHAASDCPLDKEGE